MSNPDVITVVGLLGGSSSGGIAALTLAEVKAKERKEKFLEVINNYRVDRLFNKNWFWAFLYLVVRIAELIAGAMILVAIIVALPIFWPGFSVYLARFGYNAGTFNQIGVGALILFILFALVITIVEPGISLEAFRHWLGKRNLERKLANRIKRGDQGYFRVQDEHCDKLAEAMAAKLRAEPGYLSEMLITKRPDDRSTLANELFVGEIFEAMMPAEFGGDWHNFRPVQNCKSKDGLPICSPQVVLREEPSRIVESLANAVSPRPSPSLREELEACLGQLKQEWQGDASALLSPPRPRPSWILYLCLAVIILAPVPVLLQRASLAPPFDKIYLSLWVLAFGCATVLVLGDRRAWTEWLAMRLKLRTSFETILKRLTSFPVYRTRKGSRVALAKFAYEYGLLNVPAKDLEAGSSLPVALALIKTQAVYFSGADLREDDPDLWFFCDLAMRRIAHTLEKLMVSEGGLSKSDLVGERLPYNTVDGFLFIVGYEYCQKNSCAGAQVCPFYDTKLCDSMLTEGFIYDRQQRHLKKIEWKKDEKEG